MLYHVKFPAEINQKNNLHLFSFNELKVECAGF